MHQFLSNSPVHRPIMVVEIVEILKVLSGGDFLDCTFGEGGHSEAFLKSGARSVVGSDRDFESIQRYRIEGNLRLDERLTLTHGRFSEVAERMHREGRTFKGILMDLGVNTRQLLEAYRGFSFHREGPLDMRMDSSRGETLLQVLERIEEEKLQKALAVCTRQSRMLARRIKEAALKQKLSSTFDLAQLAGPKRGPKHPATTLFLALRMLVNQELDEIEKAVPLLIECLQPEGRLAVLTFHSTEDHLVKTLFKKFRGQCTCEEPICRCELIKKVRSLTKKPMTPSSSEIRENPRARSAKLRCVEKLALAT